MVMYKAQYIIYLCAVSNNKEIIFTSMQNAKFCILTDLTEAGMKEVFSLLQPFCIFHFWRNLFISERQCVFNITLNYILASQLKSCVYHSSSFLELYFYHSSIIYHSSTSYQRAILPLLHIYFYFIIALYYPMSTFHNSSLYDCLYITSICIIDLYLSYRSIFIMA